MQPLIQTTRQVYSTVATVSFMQALQILVYVVAVIVDSETVIGTDIAVNVESETVIGTDVAVNVDNETVIALETV